MYVVILERVSIHSHSHGTALSDHVRSASQASQSDLVVGSKPIALTFHMPSPSISMFVSRYTIFTGMRRVAVVGVSKGAKVFWMARAAIMGVLKRVKTMKMEKIWSELPVMYMPGEGLEGESGGRVGTYRWHS